MPTVNSILAIVLSCQIDDQIAAYNDCSLLEKKQLLETLLQQIEILGSNELPAFIECPYGQRPEIRKKLEYFLYTVLNLERDRLCDR